MTPVLRLAGTPHHPIAGPIALWSSLGQLVDLSSTGARLTVRRAWAPTPGRRVRVRVGCGGESAGPLEGEVAWCLPAGRFRYEVGLRFVDPSPSCVESVRRVMARAGIVRGPAQGEVRRTA